MKALFLLIALAFPLAARAQDGDLDWGGTPRPLSAASNLELQSEIVRLSVGKDLVKTDSQVVLVNRGAACDVEIGFPDDSFERIAGGFENTLAPSHFKSFRLTLDGKAVATRLKSGPEAGEAGTIYRILRVHFAARGRRGGARRLRAQFSTFIGGETGFKSELASYTLRTGSHWRGPIGRSEIEVKFERAPGRIINAVALETLQKRSKVDLLSDFTGQSEMRRRLKTVGHVVYSGPRGAQVKGNTVRWTATHWRPTAEDDLFFWFKMP